MFDDIKPNQQPNSNPPTGDISADLNKNQNNQNKQKEDSAFPPAKETKDPSLPETNNPAGIVKRPSIDPSQPFIVEKKPSASNEPEDIFHDVDKTEDQGGDYINQPPNVEMAANLGISENKGDEIDGLENKKSNKTKIILMVIVVFLVAIVTAWFAYTYFISSTEELSINQNGNSNSLPAAANVNIPVNTNTDAVIKVTKPPIDTDNDGLTDEDEIKFGTNPELADTDGDGLSDQEEVKYKTNPLDNDSDGDGYLDGDEVKNGYNPVGEGKLLDTVELP
jgi:hypothetical protein